MLRGSPACLLPSQLGHSSATKRGTTQEHFTSLKTLETFELKEPFQAQEDTQLEMPFKSPSPRRRQQSDQF